MAFLVLKDIKAHKLKSKFICRPDLYRIIGLYKQIDLLSF